MKQRRGIVVRRRGSVLSRANRNSICIVIKAAGKRCRLFRQDGGGWYKAAVCQSRYRSSWCTMKPVLRSLLPGMSLMAGLALAEPWDFSEGLPASLPALSRYEAPVFPQRLRPTTVTSGYATMIFTVRPDGNIEDAMALEASDPAFIETTIE